MKPLYRLLVAALLVWLPLTGMCQSALESYATAKELLEAGDTEACLQTLRTTQAVLGGSNAKIEALKCQALVEKADWVNAAIAYNNYAGLLPAIKRSGEEHETLLELKKTIWDELSAIDEAEKEAREKEIKEDLAEAVQAEKQQKAARKRKAIEENEEHEKQLYEAAIQSKDEELLQLYQRKAKSNNESLNRVKTEIDKKKNPTSYLAAAIKNNDPQELNYLLKLGANFTWQNALGESLLHQAISHRAEKVFRQLLVLKVNLEAPDEEGHTPLIKSIVKENPVFVNLLLENGAALTSVNTRTRDSPIYYALQCQEFRIAELLIKRGVDPNGLIALEGDEVPPLYVVAHQGKSLDFTSRLLDLGARIENMGSNRVTPLMAAVKNKDEKLVNLLLNRGAAINMNGQGNRTALHVAVEQRDPAMTQYLIQRAGASKKRKDAEGKTPVQRASLQQDKATLAVLKKTKPLIELTSNYALHERQYLLEFEKLALKKEISGNSSRKLGRFVKATGILVMTAGACLALIKYVPEEGEILSAVVGGAGIGWAINNMRLRNSPDLIAKKQRLREVISQRAALNRKNLRS